MKRRGSSRLRGSAGALALCALLAALALPAAAAANGGASTSIVGGRASSISDFPSLAFIEAVDKREGGFSCTGTVIAPRVILTAAHCVEDLERSGGFVPAHDYAVATGATDPFQAGAENIFRIVATHVFPDFDPGSLRGDAGILVLDRPTLAPAIPLATAADGALYMPGTPVQLAGWGLQRGNSTAPPRRLRSTPLVLQDSSFCKRKTHSYYPPYSPAAQSCTLDSPAKASGGCFGDSGGPAIALRPDGSQVEVGITSSGAPNCTTKLPTVLTRADAVSTWAAEWIAAVETGAAPPAVDPAAALPPLSSEAGKEFAAFKLASVFGSAFTENRASRGTCKRLGPTRVRCRVLWLGESRIYGGLVTVFLLRKRDAVIWDSRYRIGWISLSCEQTKHRQRSCPVHIRQG